MRIPIIAGLDIGGHSLKMVVARIGEQGELEIIGAAEEPSSGVRRGAVVNPEEVAKRISILRQRLEQMISRRIDEVTVNIGGSHIFVMPSHGIVAVSRADGSISEEDVERVLQAAQALSLDPNKEVINTFPRQFIIDGSEGLKDVVGMRGVRLEVDVLALCAFAPYMRHLTTGVLGSGLSISDIMPSPLASAQAVLSPQQRELGSAVIDIGAGTTSLAVFEEGDLIHTTVLPIGSENISKDIAIGLRTEPNIAEQIKLMFGGVGLRGKKAQKASLPDGSQLSFSQALLTRIIEARVKEIFQLVNKELKQISRQGKLPAGIVLTGGGAKLPFISDFAKKELKLSAKLGVPGQHIIGAPED